MAAQSRGARTAGPMPVGSAGNSNSLSRRSSHSSGSGHLRPAAEARSRYRLTLDWLMEQLRAISLCRSPRSYRSRNTSLIWRMDKPFWGIRFLLERGEIPMSCPTPPFCSNSDGLIPERYYQSRFHPDHGARFIHFPGTVIHMPGIRIHIPGIDIHILPEFLFTSLRNPYSHAPEYAGIA